MTSKLESCGPTYIIASVQIWDEKALEQLEKNARNLEDLPYTK